MAGQFSPFTSGTHKGSQTGTTDLGLKRRQVDHLIDILSVEEVPLLKLFGLDGDPGITDYLEWYDDELAGEETLALAGSTIIGSGAGTKIKVSADAIYYFQKGNVLRVSKASDRSLAEYMWVSADPDTVNNEVTVIRAADGGTPRTDFAANDVVQIVGIAVAEGSDPPSSALIKPKRYWNTFQIFETSYEVSHRAANTPLLHAKSDVDYQLAKKFKELMVKLEHTVMLGQRSEGANGAPAMTGGIDFFINPTDSTVSDLAGAALTEKALNDFLQTIWEKVGPAHMGKVLVCNAWAKRKISGFYAPAQTGGSNADAVLRVSRKDRTLGRVVDTIETDFGKFKVLLHYRCPKNAIYLINPEYISVHPYTNSAFYDEELARTKAAVTKHLYGDYSVKVKNVKTMGKITKFSLTN